MAQFIHETVLLQETVAALEPQSGGRYIDCTLGGAGHSRLLLQQSEPLGMLLALDQDENAINNAKISLEPFLNRVQFVQTNFRSLEPTAKARDFFGANGVMFDLGVSSPQFDEPERGFSYRFDAPLDMRMDARREVTAESLVNELSEEELAHVFFHYGEEKFSRRIARRIVEARTRQRITSTEHLAELVKEAIPAAARRTGPHPARRVFQALRIAVNDELEALREGLEAALHVVSPKGRIAVITFHSLEDRIVKQVFQDWARGCICPPDFPVCQCHRVPRAQIITRKPTLPTEEEVARNPRARSAKLRVAQKAEAVHRDDHN